MLSEDDSALAIFNSPGREDVYKSHGSFGRAPNGFLGALLSEGGSTSMAKKSSKQAEWFREESHCRLRGFTQVGSGFGGCSLNVRPGAFGNAHADTEYFSDMGGLFPMDGTRSSNWQRDATEMGDSNGCVDTTYATDGYLQPVLGEEPQQT
jgi:hypothetical protein